MYIKKLFEWTEILFSNIQHEKMSTTFCVANLFISEIIYINI